MRNAPDSVVEANRDLQCVAATCCNLLGPYKLTTTYNKLLQVAAIGIRQPPPGILAAARITNKEMRTMRMDVVPGKDGSVFSHALRTMLLWSALLKRRTERLLISPAFEYRKGTAKAPSF